jgi:hypothetical protein
LIYLHGNYQYGELNNMKTLIILFIFCQLSYSQSLRTFFEDSVRFKGKVVIGTSDGTYDVNLYRDASNVLKTDDDLEVVGYLKFKTVKLNVSGDSLIIIDGKDSLANRGWVRWLFAQTTKPHWDSITNKPAKITNLVSSSLNFSNGGTNDYIYESTTNGEAGVSFNYHGYNNGTTQFRDVTVYDGKENQVAIFKGSNKKLTVVGKINTLDGFEINGSALTITNLDGDLTDFPAQSSNSGKVLTTDGSALSWSNTFNSLTLGQLDLTATTGKITGASDISIQPVDNGSLAIGYSKANIDLLLYNNTDVKFSVQETGAGYFASTVDAIAYKVNGSVGTSGQVLVSNGTTGGVWNTVPGALTDGDKGDVVVSSSGTVWTVEAAAGLPSQSGNSGKYLTTNGTTLSWGAGTGGIATAVYDDAQENSFTASDLLKVEDDLGEVNPENARTNLGFSTSVSMTEYGYLANVTSDIQSQLNGKASTSDLSNYYLASNPSGYLSAGSSTITTMQTDISTNTQDIADLWSQGYQTAAQVSSAISAALSSFISSHTSTIQYIDWGINEASMNVLVP